MLSEGTETQSESQSLGVASVRSSLTASTKMKKARQGPLKASQLFLAALRMSLLSRGRHQPHSNSSGDQNSRGLLPPRRRRRSRTHLNLGLQRTRVKENPVMTIFPDWSRRYLRNNRYRLADLWAAGDDLLRSLLPVVCNSEGRSDEPFEPRRSGRPHR